jgi:hypothetical protein
MIQGFINDVCDGSLRDSIESDIEAYGLPTYLEALRSYLESHPDQQFNDAAVLLNEAIDRAIDNLES